VNELEEKSRTTWSLIIGLVVLAGAVSALFSGILSTSNVLERNILLFSGIIASLFIMGSLVRLGKPNEN
jgi:hypothetical protein